MRIVGAVSALAIIVGATAAITYGLTKHQSQALNYPGTASSSTHSSVDIEDPAAAKNHLCLTFDIGTRNQAGKGGLRVDGQQNIPLLVRTINSASAVQNALTPAVPSDVARAAHEYIDRTFDLTTAATGDVSVETINDLNTATNKAIDSLLNSCELPR